MSVFPLQLFPAGALDHSVLTTVWVGISVVAIFNLRLGWPLSGLVVPGYLVPLLLVKPWAGAVVIAEGITTYLIVYLLSERASRLGAYSSFFGRDRFFALVLFSVLVRFACDGWLWPAVGEALASGPLPGFDYRNNLHSFGLVIVALVGNQFWKTGLRRGLSPFFVTLGITYLVVRYGLMELTNYSMSGLQYMYEDIAVGLFASPKAYIVLLTTAFVASRMNLLYSWDFHGILVPSLLALVWHEPWKIAATFLEALIVLLLSQGLMRLPPLSAMTVEGARKLLLFFNVAFFYKMALAHAIAWWRPDDKISDYFAFGFMLSTLMATRMHDKDIATRLSRVTLQVSLAAAIAGNLAGYGLTLLPKPWLRPPASLSAPAPAPLEESGESLETALRRTKGSILMRRAPGTVALPGALELDAFEEALRRLRDHVERRDEAALEQARVRLWAAGYGLRRLGGRHLMLTELGDGRGWGAYALDVRRPDGIVLEVPAPVEEPGTLEAAAVLAAPLGASAVAVAGAGRRVDPDGAADVLASGRTQFQAFHRMFGRSRALQVRGAASGSVTTGSILRIHKDLPRGLDLSSLRELVPGLALEWGGSHGANLQRDTAPSAFAELVLAPQDSRRLLGSRLEAAGTWSVEESPERLDAFLLKLLGGLPGARFRDPEPRELLFFDLEVLSPAFEAARLEGAADSLSRRGRDELAIAAAAARLVGYRLLVHRHSETGRSHVVLVEDSAAPESRGWGTFVARLGPAEPYVLQAPRTVAEPGSFEQALRTYDSLEAFCLLSVPGLPLSAADPAGAAGLLPLASQAALRALRGQPSMLLQVRGFAPRIELQEAGAGALLSTVDGAHSPERLPPLSARLLRELAAAGLGPRLVDGSALTAGYEAAGNPLLALASRSGAHEAGIVWVSAKMRRAAGRTGESDLQEAHFNALGVATVRADLLSRVTSAGGRASGSPPPGLLAAIEQFVRRQDVVALAAGLDEELRTRSERVVDRDTGRGFLLVRLARDRLPIVFALAPHPGKETARVVLTGPDPAGIRRFADSGEGRLELEERR